MRTASFFLAFATIAFALFPTDATAQILITNASNKKPTDSLHTLLELRNDTSNGNMSKPGYALALPYTDTAKKRKLGEYKTAPIPEGTVVYDTTNKHLYVWTKIGPTKLWRPLADALPPSAILPELVDITKSDLNSDPFSATPPKPVTKLAVKTPTGHKIFNGNGGAVNIVYNGITLRAGQDFKVENQTDSLVITFQTLLPEKFENFSAFTIQYVPNP